MPAQSLASPNPFLAELSPASRDWTQRCLDYCLSRELSNHIGQGARFRDDRARSEFDGALDQHCREASRIVEAFAGGWCGKNVYQGDVTPG
jgi:hypothetical protein